ncbi:MAG: hypothetical protein KDJ97_12590, partial [Anaerolineae bacterium]|nr:hypothetical protein [Anaerolineae bacterium]
FGSLFHHSPHLRIGAGHWLASPFLVRPVYSPSSAWLVGISNCHRWVIIVVVDQVTVENIICGIKRCRILKDTFRNHLPGFDDLVIEIAFGLHNLRVRYRHPTEHFDLFEFVA